MIINKDYSWILITSYAQKEFDSLHCSTLRLSYPNSIENLVVLYGHWILEMQHAIEFQIYLTDFKNFLIDYSDCSRFFVQDLLS